jgi:hypothetical protein
MGSFPCEVTSESIVGEENWPGGPTKDAVNLSGFDFGFPQLLVPVGCGHWYRRPITQSQNPMSELQGSESRALKWPRLDLSLLRYQKAVVVVVMLP